LRQARPWFALLTLAAVSVGVPGTPLHAQRLDDLVAGTILRVHLRTDRAPVLQGALQSRDSASITVTLTRGRYDQTIARTDIQRVLRRELLAEADRGGCRGACKGLLIGATISAGLLLAATVVDRGASESFFSMRALALGAGVVITAGTTIIGAIPDDELGVRWVPVPLR
jgi:hypothetical protein